MPAGADRSGLAGCCASLYELPITSVLLGRSFHPGGNALTIRLADSALVGRDSRVLDVASGTGESARLVADHFGCHVHGVDYSEVNTAVARRLTEQAELAHRVVFSQGDAEKLRHPDASFDVVLCECALCTFPDMSVALSEMRRVLAPHGRIGISDMVLSAAIPPELDNVMSHVLCIRGALSAHAYEDALLAAGFTNVRYRDATSALLDLVSEVQARIPTVLRLAAAGELELPADFGDPAPVLVAARDFIRSGGVGYALFTARA